MTRDELDAKIRELCEAREMRFAPWECHPADADEGASPWPPNTRWCGVLAKGACVTARLIAEIEGAGAAD